MGMQEKQAEFMKLMKQKIGSVSESLDLDIDVPAPAVLYADLIEEEAEEIQDAFQAFIDATYEDEMQNAYSDLAKECADLLVVLLGFCNALGIPLESCFNETHNSNMRKAQRNPDGTFRIIRREDGKILKPEGWTPPDITKILDLQRIREQTL